METYESDFGKTTSGNMRGGAMFDTYNANFYLDKDNKVVGIQSDNINNGKIYGDKTNISTTKLGVGNIIKYIIENEKYLNIDEFIKEINIAYSYKINKIISENNEKKEAA